MYKRQEQYTTGRVMNHRFTYALNDGVKITQTFPDSVSVALDNGREYSGGNGAGANEISTNEGVNGQIQPFAIMDDTDVQTISECPVYSVDLSDLFPFLKTHSLPLYMIDQQMSIELYWSPLVGQRGCVPQGAAATGTFSIDRNELKFCADYIFYTDNDSMNRYAEANPVIEFAFPDYRLSKTTITQADLLVGQVRNIGMANRLVSRVLTTISDDAVGPSSMMNRYNSIYPSRASATLAAGSVVYNLRYNDRFEFPINLTNPAQLFSHFTQSESIPFVTREEYSRQQQGLTNVQTFEGHLQNNPANVKTGLAGNSFMLGTKLTGGRVGQRGIELHLTMGDAIGGMPGAGGTQYTVRSWSEYMRIARLSDGGMSVFNM